jgi:hypothetical protein
MGSQMDRALEAEQIDNDREEMGLPPIADTVDDLERTVLEVHAATAEVGKLLVEDLHSYEEQREIVRHAADLRKRAIDLYDWLEQEFGHLDPFDQADTSRPVGGPEPSDPHYQ